MDDPAQRAAATAAAHAQRTAQVRLDWGPTGAAAISAGADITVVVDVLSFTTTLSIATARGTRVFPCAWKDDRASDYAAEKGAALAIGRFEARRLDRPTASLSPAQLLDSAPVPRLVLPSPNGSTVCAALRAAHPRLQVIGASLRNRSAVARWLAPHVRDGATVAVVPAGERWPDGTLRPSVEDLWGAGAVLDQLGAERGSAASPEARHAVTSYRHVAGQLADALARCGSGQELIAVGFGVDVAVAAQLDVDDVVPLLTDEGFVDVTS